MIVVLADVLPAIAVGVLVFAAVAAWPRLDPTSPHLASRALRAEVDAHPSLRAALRRRVDPAQVMGGLLAVAVGTLIAMATLLGVVAVMIRTNRGLARADARAAQWGADHANDTATTFLRIVSMLAGTQWGIVILAVVAVAELQRRSRRTVLAFLLLTVVGQNVIVNVTKLLVGRARPDYDRLTGFASSSFPSGHAAQGAAMFAAFALVLGRGRSRRVRALLSGGAAAIATAVAASRVLLGVHWVTDVVAGLAVGWGWFAAVSVAFGGRWLHFAAPVEAAVELAETGDGR